MLTPHPWLIRMGGVGLCFQLRLFLGGPYEEEGPRSYTGKHQPQNGQLNGLHEIRNTGEVSVDAYEKCQQPNAGEWDAEDKVDNPQCLTGNTRLHGLFYSSRSGENC